MLPTHDQFDSISESGIEETTNSLTQLDTELFRRKTEKRGKRDDSQEVDDEDGGRVDIQRTQNDTNRDKDQENIDIVASEHLPRRVQERHRVPDPSSFVLV